MLQRLQIAFTQVKVGNTSGNLLNETCQIIYSLHQPKQLHKKVYSNIMILIKIYYKMDIIPMNSKNSKTSKSQRLLPNLSHKINVKRSDKYVALWNLIMYLLHMEKSYKNNKSKISAPVSNENLNYLTHHLLYLIFKIILSISSKTSNSSC